MCPDDIATETTTEDAELQAAIERLMPSEPITKAVFNDPDHPDVSLAEWEAFKAVEKARQSLFTDVVDRQDSGFFPKWFVPLARGVVIASPALLCEVIAKECPGHETGFRRTATAPGCVSGTRGVLTVRTS
jgi:hypothetical protein